MTTGSYRHPEFISGSNQNDQYSLYCRIYKVLETSQSVSSQYSVLISHYSLGQIYFFGQINLLYTLQDLDSVF